MGTDTAGFLDVPGGKLFYEVNGDGPALTLIHAGVAHLRQWDEQVRAFSPPYRVIRYDTRGFGRTITEDVPFSNREDLRRLLDHLGVGRTHLVAMSRGATIALDFTLENPDRVSSLVFGCSTPSGFSIEETPEAQAYWEEQEQIEERQDWDTLVENEVRYWTDGPGQSPDRVPASLRASMTQWGLENYHNGQPYGSAQPLDPPAVGRLAEVRVPVLVAWGGLDEAGVLAGCEFVAAGIPGAGRHVFGGAAHMINLEQPAAFDALVLDFLASAEQAATAHA